MRMQLLGLDVGKGEISEMLAEVDEDGSGTSVYIRLPMCFCWCVDVWLMLCVLNTPDLQA